MDAHSNMIQYSGLTGSGPAATFPGYWIYSLCSLLTAAVGFQHVQSSLWHVKTLLVFEVNIFFRAILPFRKLYPFVRRQNEHAYCEISGSSIPMQRQRVTACNLIPPVGSEDSTARALSLLRQRETWMVDCAHLEMGPMDP